MGDRKSEPLFDPEILTKLNFSVYNSPMKISVSPYDPDSPLLLRPLYSSDYEKGFLPLLNQLSKVGDISCEKFLQRFYSMKHCANMYYVVVVEDTNIKQVVGAATLIVEKKFIHECGMRGMLEDVVVSDEYRGRQLGKCLVIAISLLAEYVGCYKITLNCKDKLISFYECLNYALGPDESNNCMTIRFNA